MICELLNYYQELDERLKVRKRKYIHDEDEEEDVRDDGYNPNNRKVGTNKRCQFYKEYPSELKFDPQCSTYFRHTVQFTSTSKNVNYKYREFVPDAEGESLGLLTSEPLPDYAPIPIHHPGGEYSAHVSQVKMAKIDVDSARNFTELIMTTVLKVWTPCLRLRGNFLVVPLKNTRINVDLLNAFSDKVKIKKVILDQVPLQVSLQVEIFNANLYTGAYK